MTKEEKKIMETSKEATKDIGIKVIKELYNLGYTEEEILQILISQTTKTAFDKLTPDQKIDYLLSQDWLWEAYQRETGADISIEGILKRNGVYSDEKMKLAEQIVKDLLP